MSEITQEIFDELPGVVQMQYEKDGDAYVTVDSKKVTALKSSLDGLDGKVKGYESQLTEAANAEADKIAAAKEEAYKEALAKNNTEEATRLLQEKLDDAERRNNESKAQFQKRLEGVAIEKQSVIVKELSLLGSESGKPALERLLKQRVTVDAETGAETYLNDDGSASSLNKQQFIDSLKDDVVFKPLLKGELPTNGGGFSNGSNGGSAPSSEPKKYSEMNPEQKRAFLKKQNFKRN